MTTTFECVIVALVLALRISRILLVGDRVSKLIPIIKEGYRGLGQRVRTRVICVHVAKATLFVSMMVGVGVNLFN